MSASLMVQGVKNPPAIRETQEMWVQSVGWEDRLRLFQRLPMSSFSSLDLDFLLHQNTRNKLWISKSQNIRPYWKKKKRDKNPESKLFPSKGDSI